MLKKYLPENSEQVNSNLKTDETLTAKVYNHSPRVIAFVALFMLLGLVFLRFAGYLHDWFHMGSSGSIAYIIIGVLQIILLLCPSVYRVIVNPKEKTYAEETVTFLGVLVPISLIIIGDMFLTPILDIMVGMLGLYIYIRFIFKFPKMIFT